MVWVLIRVTFLPGTLDSQSEDDKEYVEASENTFLTKSENTALDFFPKLGKMGHGPDMNFGLSRNPQFPFCKNFARLYMFDRSAWH